MEKTIYLVEVGYTARVEAKDEFEALSKVSYGVKYGLEDISELSAKVGLRYTEHVPAPEPVPEAPIEVHFPDATSAFGSSDTSDIPF